MARCAAEGKSLYPSTLEVTAPIASPTADETPAVSPPVINAFIGSCPVNTAPAAPAAAPPAMLETTFAMLAAREPLAWVPIAEATEEDIDAPTPDTIPPMTALLSTSVTLPP